MVSAGVTGGIGSGKTAVCRLWEKLGAYVIYADDLAKRLMVEDAILVSHIRNAFGEQAYRHDGSLNREWLSRQAFQQNRVKELNRLVHPRVQQETLQLKEQAKRGGYPLFVKEAALLLAYGRPADLDYVVVVDAPEEQRIKWVSERDRMDEQQVRQRMRHQPSVQDMRQQADIIIENDQAPGHLERQARSVYHRLLEKTVT